MIEALQEQLAAYRIAMTQRPSPRPSPQSGGGQCDDDLAGKHPIGTSLLSTHTNTTNTPSWCTLYDQHSLPICIHSLHFSRSITHTLSFYPSTLSIVSGCSSRPLALCLHHFHRPLSYRSRLRASGNQVDDTLYQHTITNN